MRFRSSTHDRFYVVKTNNRIDEFYSINDCLEQTDIQWIIHDRFEKYFTQIAGYEWRIPNYKFYQEYPTECKLGYEKCLLQNIEISRITVDRIDFIATFADPSKRIRRLDMSVKKYPTHSDANDIIVVSKILEQLMNFSKFQSWEHIDLLRENETLRKEIEELKKSR